VCSNGFRLLKPGGTLVYSTCSFATAQNEAIVDWFLHCTPEARSVPVAIPSAAYSGWRRPGHPDAAAANLPCTPGSSPLTVRFGPLTGTSGLFIAKFTKEP
jgi:16S rRNA C967 or C1407 C5-methylase (RsmB/RsmF family)